jgi:hypothetical protein
MTLLSGSPLVTIYLISCLYFYYYYSYYFNIYYCNYYYYIYNFYYYYYYYYYHLIACILNIFSRELPLLLSRQQQEIVQLQSLHRRELLKLLQPHISNGFSYEKGVLHLLYNFLNFFWTIFLADYHFSSSYGNHANPTPASRFFWS